MSRMTGRSAGRCSLMSIIVHVFFPLRAPRSAPSTARGASRRRRHEPIPPPVEVAALPYRFSFVSGSGSGTMFVTAGPFSTSPVGVNREP